MIGFGLDWIGGKGREEGGREGEGQTHHGLV